MPKPEPGESEKDYVGRCMAFPDLQERDPAQREAICHSMWKEAQDEAHGWYRFANQVADGDLEAELYVYDVIGGGWEADSITSKRFVADLAALPKSVKNIKLHINSPGGSVFDAVAIANSLKSHKANVSVAIEGLAASAATVVAMGGKEITIAENALMMIHDPYGFTMGGAKEMRAQADALDRVRDSIVATYRWHSQLPADEIAAMMEDVTWMSAEEAVAHGFATKIGPAAKAAAHLDDKLLARIGPVPERFAALLASQDVKVPPESIAAPVAGNALSPAKAAVPKKKGKKMSEPVEKVETENTATADALAEAKAAGFAEGVKAERERILGIEKIALPGHEALVAELKADGKTTPGEAASKIVEAEKATRERRLEAIKRDGLAPAPSANATSTGDIKPAIDDASRPLEDRAKAEWDRNAANEDGVRIQDEFTSFDAFLALKQNEHRIRILRVVNR